MTDGKAEVFGLPSTPFVPVFVKPGMGYELSHG